MNCPEHLILNIHYIQIWHHQRADIDRKYVTWREVLNPLRYEICIGNGPGKYFYINYDANLHIKFSNFTWRLYRKKGFLKTIKEMKNPWTL